MSNVDQNSAFQSMSRALIPGEDMIDGRTEADRLHFLCEFAKLINFYDNTNTPGGNWSPFLLKDPVFLVANISKTKTDRFYAPYYNACLKLQKSMDRHLFKYDRHVAIAFNQVFDQLTLVFMRIERWTHYMQLADEHYDLKHYLVHQVKERFAALFWALQSLREALFISSVLPDIERVYYYLFDKYDELTWKISRDKIPYWQLLQMKGPMIDEGTLGGIEWPSEKAMEKAESAIREKGFYYYSDFWENPSLIRESAKPLLCGEIACDCYAALQSLGDELFNFTNTIVHNAATELQKITKHRSRYPDTTLLRAFLDLLNVHQNQLNGLAEKHLRFYYKDILKQAEKPAHPDKAFVYATLSADNAAYILPAGTGFNGGVDANKNPIVFSTTENVCLNPALIAEACTLSVHPDPANKTLSNYYLQSIVSPTTPQTNKSGVLQSWPTFGGMPPATLQPVSTSVAFASPMLLLREGQRTIVFSMTCTSTVSQTMLTAANYYLSTGAGWQELLVNAEAEPNLSQSSIMVNRSTAIPSINLQIDLPVSQSPITPFTKNPDGYSSPWPLFKITFNGMDDPANPPQITSITIKTTVTGLSGTPKLYNDNGAISTKNPYQPFGPLPLLNSSFIIGSDEIFSKPATLIYLTLKWNNLPAAFDAYYSAYNDYLGLYPAAGAAADPNAVSSSPSTSNDAPTTSNANAAPSATAGSNKMWQFIISIFVWLAAFLKSIIIRRRSSPKASAARQSAQKLAGSGTASDGTSTGSATSCPTPFNNICFTVGFSVLQQSEWIPLTPVQLNNITVDQYNTITPYTYSPGSCCTLQTPPSGINLFGTTDITITAETTTPCTILNTSFYEIAPPDNSPIVIPDPDLQNAALSYPCGNGFMKLSIAAPVVGFGSSVYANVVTWAAMQNAVIIKNSRTTPPPPQSVYTTPNPPFSPKLSSLTVHYEATQTYLLTDTSGPYPLQCFMYTPFETFPAYDNSANPPLKANNMTGNLCGVKGNSGAVDTSAGLPLFPALNYKGILYLGLQNLVTPNTLNFYFQMAQSYGSSSGITPPDFYYLRESGWDQLTIVQDTTNILTCSGIIVADIHEDIVTNNTMPANNGNCWIAMAASDNPDAYPQTVMLNTNGFSVQRSGNTFLSSRVAPALAATSITKPVAAIPQIKAISQPFASFGGKAVETDTVMNLRVSNRLKTKDRAVSCEDYFRIIKQKFNTIYYSKTIYDGETNSTQVYVVQSFLSWQDPGAFVPLVTECQLSSIQQHLISRSSPFANISVSNFRLTQVTITAGIGIESGYSGSGVIKAVEQALNIFLSPWITSSGPQIAIDKKMTLGEVTNFIASVPGVSSVSNVTVMPDCMLTTSAQQPRPSPEIKPPQPPALIVSSMNHNIFLV